MVIVNILRPFRAEFFYLNGIVIKHKEDKMYKKIDNQKSFVEMEKDVLKLWEEKEVVSTAK